MSKLIDLTGQRFGRLTVLERAGSNNRRKALWICICDCGNTVKTIGTCLRSGKTKSCGCLSRELSAARGRAAPPSRYIHGGCGTRLYHIWQLMIKRCCDPKNQKYVIYGGRGIAVCDEWKISFVAFRDWALTNGYHNDLSLDRIAVDGNYEPNNCRWVGMKVQQNNRTNNHHITHNNKTQTLAQWAEELHIAYYTLFSRLRRGWSVEEALTTPVGGKRHNK